MESIFSSLMLLTPNRFKVHCCFCSVAKSCLTLCDPMDCSMPGFSVLYHLPDLAQTHVHWVSDAIQPSHPLSSPLLLPPIFPSIRVFSNVSSLHQVAKVLEFQLQHQFFQWTPKDWSLGWTGWISLQSMGLSRVFSNTTVKKHQFFSAQLSLWFSSHIHSWCVVFV